MRILVHDYAGHPFQIQLSRELARQGHTVLHAYAAALQTPRGDLERRADDPAGFAVREVAMDPEYAKWKYSFRRRRSMEIAYGRRAAALVAEWKPEVVLSSNTPTETQRPILQAAEQAGARFVYWCQDFYSLAVDKLVRKKIPVLGGLIGSWYRRMDREQFTRSHAVVAITEDFRPIMEKDFGVAPEKIHAVPNWAPIETLPVLPQENAWSIAQGLAGKFVYLYTGTLGMKHNPELLLLLAKQYAPVADVRVVVISEGPGAEWLRQKKEEMNLTNLVLLPYQPFAVMPQVLASGALLIAVLEEDAGIFSVPSKVLTYLCAQRPLLLSVPQVNLAARIVSEERAGLTVAPGDEEALRSAAARFFASPEYAAQCGERARAYAERTFRIGDIAERFARILA